MNQLINQPEMLKDFNRSRVIDVLQRERVLSRLELAKHTGLSRPTIAVLVDELTESGIVSENGTGDSTGGRRPVLLKFNPNAAFALGARMRDREWDIVLTNLDAEVVAYHHVRMTDDTIQNAVDALREGVERLTTGQAQKRILPAIGLGTPGLVDTHSGIVKTAVDVGWFEVPIRSIVEETLGIRTFVANRSRVGALAELWNSKQAEVRNLIYVSIGTGVAAGIIVDGSIYMGANSSAGELGHITVIPDGPLCPCGNRGCLQQLVSAPAIANRARQLVRSDNSSLLLPLAGHYPERISFEGVFDAAEKGDALALQVVAEVATYLGIALANVVNLFNPERIILGGPVGERGHILLPVLDEVLRRRAMAYPLSTVQVSSTSLGAYAGAIGAAVMVLQRASELLFINGGVNGGINGGNSV